MCVCVCVCVHACECMHVSAMILSDVSYMMHANCHNDITVNDISAGTQLLECPQQIAIALLTQVKV